jgi:diguanylate cyclase (GGDEF)-like protein
MTPFDRLTSQGPLRLLWQTLFGLLFLSVPVLALDPSKSVTQYVRTTWEDRLPHNTVRAILQTRDGYIWVGTYEGLARFDGADFAVFDSRNTAMSSSAISALTEDSGGRLWVGTAGGGLYRFDGRVMTPVPLGTLGVMISSLASDDQGNVWVATRGGLGRIQGDRLQLFGGEEGLPSQLIWSLRMVGRRELWVATEGGGLLQYVGGRFRALTTANGLSSNVVYSLASGRSGELWIGNAGGVDVMRDGRIAPALPNGSPLSGKPVFALLQDRDGNVWISGGNSGVCRLVGNVMSCEPEAAGSDLIRAFAEDREGNIWVGGTNRGLWQMRDAKLMTTTGIASTNHIRCVTEDAEGRIWVGTDGSGVNVVREGMLEPVEQNGRLPSPFIRSLLAGKNGDLWVGTLGGLARLRGEAVKNYRVADGLASDIVHALLESRDGTLWIGTTRGINRLRGDTVESLPFRGDVRALLEDPNGRVWIGRRDGLSCFENGKAGDCGAPENLRTATVFSIERDRRGIIWIGTNHGVARYANGRFTMYSSRDGLFDDNVFRILEDDHGHLWMSSNRGIWSVPVGDFEAFDSRRIPALRSTAFGKSDGMGSTQCNGGSQPAGWKSRDGRLWFPTVRGLVTVDVPRIHRNEIAPPVVISKVVVDSRVADGKLLSAIPPGTERYEFHYSGLSFVAPERVRFRFKLEGYDHNWVEAGTRRVAYYTNLPPRELTFRVMASNSDGVWSERPASLRLRIEPHFYDTWWFRTLCAAALLGLLFLAYRVRVRHLERRALQLAALVDERTEALQTANLELERLAAVDGLTKIPNRRSFDQKFAAMWSEHGRRRSPLTVLLCDVDHFKKYNDQHGHQAGDAALVNVATTISRNLRRASDFAARYGGEEFVILLGDTTAEQALILAEALLTSVRDMEIPHGGSEAGVVTLSAGVASIVPDRSLTPADLLSAADAALYNAKAQGRDRVEVARAVEIAERAHG